LSQIIKYYIGNILYQSVKEKSQVCHSLTYYYYYLLLRMIMVVNRLWYLKRKFEERKLIIKTKSIDNCDYYSIILEDKNKLEKTFSKLESRPIGKLGTERVISYINLKRTYINATLNTVNMSSDSIEYNPGDIIKKEARGLGEADLGEVQEISGEYIITQKGNVGKDKFYIPKDLLERFDGNTVYLRVTEEEAKQYKKE
jgi:hypothetical protein